MYTLEIIKKILIVLIKLFKKMFKGTSSLVILIIFTISSMFFSGYFIVEYFNSEKKV